MGYFCQTAIFSQKTIFLGLLWFYSILSFHVQVHVQSSILHQRRSNCCWLYILLPKWRIQLLAFKWRPTAHVWRWETRDGRRSQGRLFYYDYGTFLKPRNEFPDVQKNAHKLSFKRGECFLDFYGQHQFGEEPRHFLREADDRCRNRKPEFRKKRDCENVRKELTKLIFLSLKSRRAARELGR